MSRIVRVKNNSGAEDTWGGQTIANGAEYDLDLPTDLTNFKNNKTQTDIASGDIQVSNGTNYFTDTILAWDWLIGNTLEISNLPKSDTKGHLKVEQHKPEGSSSIIVSHDFSDPCTWYGDSITVVDEVLVDSGDGLTFESPHKNWIDLSNGRMTNENDIVASYPIVLSINDVNASACFMVYATSLYETVNYTAKKIGTDGNTISLAFDGTDNIKTVVDAWNASNPYNPVLHDAVDSQTVPTSGTVDLVSGDYCINAEKGTVTFHEDQSGNTIKASYNYENGANYYLIPDAGKELEITRAEIQFSKDVKMHSPINFEVWVYYPDQVTYPGLKVKYQVESYKNIRDFVSTGNEGQGVIPALDGMLNEVVVFPFDYNTIKLFQSEVGAELRITVDDDIPVEGEFATGTFYIVSRTS